MCFENFGSSELLLPFGRIKVAANGASPLAVAAQLGHLLAMAAS